MKKMFFLLLCTICTLTVSSQELQGKWNFKADYAPWEYNQGEVEFKKVKNVLTGKISFPYDTFNVNFQRKKTDTYVCSFYVDGTAIDVTIVMNNGKLTGTAKADGMNMDIEFMKNRKEK